MRRKPNIKVRRTSIHLEKNCLNVTSVDGAIVNLSQKKKKKEMDRPGCNVLQYSNDEITNCFWQQLSRYT